MSYKLKHAPEAVTEYFERQFPKADGYTHHFYWYWREFAQETKIYGCTVLKGRDHHHNATQAPISWYESANSQVKAYEAVANKIHDQN